MKRRAIVERPRIGASRGDSAHVDAGHVDAGHVDVGHVDSAHIDSTDTDSAPIAPRPTRPSDIDPTGVDPPHIDRVDIDRVGLRPSDIDRVDIDREAIAALVPHSGGMVLLDHVLAWDNSRITCLTRSHLDPANPLRSAGRLAATCGIEYALQAAALHGGLAAGGVAQPAGFLAALRDVTLHVDRLDDAAIGDLHVEARVERHESSGSIYALELRSQAGQVLLSGRAIIAVPRAGGG